MGPRVEESLDRYELRRAIGTGASGTVYEAWDTVLTRRVAVKVVRLAGKQPEDIQVLLARFRQEAQVASRLAHPGVVSVFDYGEKDGLAFIVMEYVAGETLKAALDRGERLPLPVVAGIMRGVLLALEHCHGRGIVHRDIKPANIMLPTEGGVKLTDFGIARIENSELTIVGTVMGTPPYMSPEQFSGQLTIDYRTDIWSSGVVLYELLTGARPFPGDTIAKISHAVASEAFEPPARRVAGLPAALDQVLARALRKAPAERFPSAEAFAEALQAAFSPAPGGGPQPARRSSRALIGGAAAIAALAAGAAAWLWLYPPAATTPAATTPAATAPDIAASLPGRLAALPCSTVTAAAGVTPGVTLLRGIIGAGAPRAGLDSLIAGLGLTAVDAGVQSFPPTPTACRLAELVRAQAGDRGAAGARLSSYDGRTSLFAGEEIRLRLRMPDFDGEVRLEDFDATGHVTHLMQVNLGAAPRQRAGTQIGLGRNGDDLIGYANQAAGSDILLAIVASGPLFSAARPPEEAGERFVDELGAAIAELRRRGGRVAADALVLTTSPR